MKRSLALLCAAVALWGCRSSTPATNPFMRSTIPPPGTGQAAPGYPGTIQPPQVLPGTPAPAPAPMAPPANQFSPPGGSFNYQQSSIDRTKAISPRANEQRVGDTALARRSTPKPSGGGSSTIVSVNNSDSGAVASTQLIASTPQTSVGFAPAGSSTKPATDSSHVDARQVVETGYNTSTIRIVDPQRKAELAASEPVQRAQLVTSEPIRLTVREAVPEITDLAIAEPGEIRKASYAAPVASSFPSGGTSQLRSLPSSSTSEPAQLAPTAGSTMPVPQSTPTSDSLPRYAHAADYTSLRGRLEYSASSRQWKLRYIPIDGDTDKFGGSVVLSNATALQGYKTGEFVAARGIISSTTSGTHSFSPNYELSRVERAQ